MSVLPWIVAAWLFGVGVYGIATSRNYIHLIGCLTRCARPRPTCCCCPSATTGAAARRSSTTTPPGTAAVDPIVQALVLTDIVIGATVSALLLAMALQVHKREGTLDPPGDQTLKGQ